MLEERVRLFAGCLGACWDMVRRAHRIPEKRDKP